MESNRTICNTTKERTGESHMKLVAMSRVADDTLECHFCNEPAAYEAKDDKCDGCGEPITMCQSHFELNEMLNTMDKVVNRIVDDMQKSGPQAKVTEVYAHGEDILFREVQPEGVTKH